ncbi:alpha/beta hydrolase [Ottowia testudinis]|uniref:Lysophospholipase n=1 Tax=Ottowia testudinis TaxID=2816950 RepID=A0A975CHP7_9BURK|nr:alpha/beta hydrolase [Ottowia testudinis]QTD45281.1 lysophospholipase [Ottowia testudinis]
MAGDPKLFSVGGAQGDALALHDWPLSAGWPTRGMVVLVHGLGEHVGRYAHVADRLNEWGFSVRGYDQYGHGETAGLRGELPADDRLLADLASVIDDTRARMDDRLPLILLGHSMGGLVAARLVSLKLRRVDALVLSSPALNLGLSVLQRALMNTLHRLAPCVRVGSGIDARYLSHDLAVVDAYRADPLVHDRISARLARFMDQAGAAVLKRAPRWKVPTLLLYAGQDKLVNPAGSHAFAAAAPPEWMTVQAFPMHYHELFNELDNAPVFEALRDWLVQRFPPIELERTGVAP